MLEGVPEEERRRVCDWAMSRATGGRFRTVSEYSAHKNKRAARWRRRRVLRRLRALWRLASLTE